MSGLCTYTSLHYRLLDLLAYCPSCGDLLFEDPPYETGKQFVDLKGVLHEWNGTQWTDVKQEKGVTT